MQVDSKSGKQVEGGVCPKREKIKKVEIFLKIRMIKWYNWLKIGNGNYQNFNYCQN
jgi:hypothetical protein